jgi:hypothetical protein
VKKRQKEYLIIGLLFLAILLAYLSFLPQPSSKKAFLIYGKTDYLTTFLDANTIVLKAIYPFSDAQGAVSAITYMAAVFQAKGKKVIIESIDNNLCYTNEGNVQENKEMNIQACELNYPTVIIKEGYNSIRIEPGKVTIQASPPYMMPAAAYILSKIYPDANLVYERVLNQLKTQRQRAAQRSS